VRPGDIQVSPKRPETLADLRVPAAIVVGTIWGLSFVIGVATDSWVALGATTPIVTIVAMAIFSIRNGNGQKWPNGTRPPTNETNGEK
jgi:hypothetical protein